MIFMDPLLSEIINIATYFPIDPQYTPKYIYDKPLRQFIYIYKYLISIEKGIASKKAHFNDTSSF